jgi:hypothetical protein
VPWCEECSKFWTPTSMARDGSCPSCGHVLAAPTTKAEPKAPWHFKLLVGAVVAYLVWRVVQLVGWVT